MMGTILKKMGFCGSKGGCISLKKVISRKKSLVRPIGYIIVPNPE